MMIRIRKNFPLVIMFLALAMVAAYSGPNRTTTTTAWERQACDYRATYPPNYSCTLTIYASPGSCPGTSSVAGYFNTNTYSCGSSFAGNCSTLPGGCSISLTGSRTEGCSSGDPGCTQNTSTTNLPPATVSGIVNCAVSGANGYCKSVAVLNLSANEPVSGWTITGIESNLGMLCTTNSANPTCAWNFPQGTTNLTYWALSSHGDTSLSTTASAKVDSVFPTVTASISGTPGSNGWYVSKPSITSVGSDATSGIFTNEISLNNGAYATTVNVTTDGTHSYRARAMDNAGNVTYNNPETIKVDTVAPTQVMDIPVVPASGWYTSPVTVSVTASDATSGVAYSEYNINGGAWVNGSSVTLTDSTPTIVRFRAYDNAGNLSSEVRNITPIRVDDIMPGISLTPSGTLGSNGWYVSVANVAVAISDAQSGLSTARYRSDGGAWIDGTSANLPFSDGMHTVNAEASDAAGNMINASFSLKVDTVAPTQTITMPTASGTNGWYVVPVTVMGAAGDATSGVGSIQYRLDGGAWTTGGAVTATGDGSHTVEFRAYDKAGNVSTMETRTFSMDVTAPTGAITLTGTTGANGWYTSAVTASVSSSDATSGIAKVETRLDAGTWSSASSLPVSGSGSHTVEARITDLAGNITMLSSAVKVDTVAPTQTLAASGITGSNGWYVSPVRVSATTSDATSGVDRSEYRVNGGAWQTGSSYTSGADGAYTVDFRAFDKAGNTSSTNSRSFSVDTIDPTGAVTVTGTPGLGAWLVADAKATITGADGGSGIAKVQYRINVGPWTDGSSFSFPDGVYFIEGLITDLAGNVVQLPGQTVSVDTTLPTGTVVTGVQTTANGWYTQNVPVTITPSDAASGVLLVEYNLDGEWRNGSVVTVTQEGMHSVSFRVTDKAGHQWESSRQLIKLDKTLPSLSVATPGNGDIVRGTLEISGAASDGLAGMDKVQVSLDGGKTWLTATLTGSTWSLDWDTLGLSNGARTILVRAVDMAGNVSQSTQVTVTVANEGPAVDVDSSWWLWQEGNITVEEANGTDLATMEINIDCHEPLPDVTLHYSNPATFPESFWWDGRCGNTEPAPGGEYTVTVNVCDTYGNCGTDTGVIKIAAISLVFPPTWTPTVTPTVTPTATPTAMQTGTSQATPTVGVTPTATMFFPPAPVTAQPVRMNTWLLLLVLLILLTLAAFLLACIVLLGDPRPRKEIALADIIRRINEKG